ncbi:hypothetical protein ABS767_12840 [Sphingomonas sp. ST-64]|uniref:Uncharacterized protein n=1 Tax=Sphingomonas plantiphila TaxID=3163295 RepID=A0ABW8YNQ0_9SPHN
MTESRFRRRGTIWMLEPSDRPVLFRAPGFAPDSETLSLTETMKAENGSYVFLPEPVETEFAAALDRFLGDAHADSPPVFLWVENPRDPVERWRTRQFDVDRSDWTVGPAGGAVELGGYALDVRPGTALRPDNLGQAFTFSHAAPPAVALRTPAGGAAAIDAALGFGAAPGCWRFKLEFPAGSEAFRQLGCGLRYFRQHPQSGAVETIAFPVLSETAGQPLRFDVQIDPVRLEDVDRTHFAFCDAPLFDSTFRTREGRAIRLRPMGEGDRAARLAFHVAPAQLGGAGLGVLHLAPAGSFAVEQDGHGGEVIRLMCGASGLEYVAMPATGATVTFVPGRPAFADPIDGRLTMQATTPWIQADGDYFAQPEQAALFAPAPPGESPLLSLLEFKVAALPDRAEAALPMVPLSGAAAADVGQGRDFEAAILAPARRAAIAALTNHGADGALAAALPGGAAGVAITPQGLGVAIGADGGWDWIGFGHTGPADAAVASLRFTKARGRLRQAFQASELFMVLGDPAEFATSGAVPYRLTAADIARLRDDPATQVWDAAILDRLAAYLQDRGFPAFADRPAFDAAISAAGAVTTAQQRDVLARDAGQLCVTIGEWTFRFSPECWAPPEGSGRAPCYLVVKYAKGLSIAQLASDPAGWTWPEVASPTGAATAARDIARQIADARRAVDRGDLNYADFVRIVDDPDWSGVLVLSAELSLTGPADDMAALRAGLDDGRFAAHHLGFAASQIRFEGGQPRFSSTPLFGLIDYRGAEDLYFAADTDYAFRVSQLTVRIENSAIVSRFCAAELTLNRLFGSNCVVRAADRGANILLVGSFQEQRSATGVAGGRFVFANRDRYLIELPQGGAIESVELDSVQLVASGAQASFQMAGRLRFYWPGAFDPFCFGPYYTIAEVPELRDGSLRFANLALDMRASDAGKPIFSLRDEALTLDLPGSVAREDSLVSRFPVRLQRLITSPPPATTDAASATPASLGYVNISAPIDQQQLDSQWYGLVYRIELGSLGALANSAPLAMDILVAWSPAERDVIPPVYLGIKLPGADSRLGAALPLQGLMTLGFKSIEFLVHDPGNAVNNYTLCLRNFAVRLLGLSFPPGRNNIYLFGNPDQTGEQAVGWYAAYVADDVSAERLENVPLLGRTLVGDDDGGR